MPGFGIVSEALEPLGDRHPELLGFQGVERLLDDLADAHLALHGKLSRPRARSFADPQSRCHIASIRLRICIRMRVSTPAGLPPSTMEPLQPDTPRNQLHTLHRWLAECDSSRV